MRRVLVASVAVLALLVTALVLVWQGDRDGWRWEAHRGGDAGSMMAGRGGAGPMGHATVRSEAGYLVEMVAHHEDAIEAASELGRSDRRRMRALGESIVESQTAQVEQMRAWLAAWYPDAAEADYEPMMSDLSGLSGDRLDRVFLRDMVAHHMVAVMMSQQLLARGIAEHQGVVALARRIRDDQRVEIAMMVSWSRVWFGRTSMMGMMSSPP